MPPLSIPARVDAALGCGGVSVVDVELNEKGDSCPEYAQIANKSAVLPSIIAAVAPPPVAPVAANTNESRVSLPCNNGRIGCT